MSAPAISAADVKALRQQKEASPTGKIEDLGEKIGGARKDTATSTGSTGRTKTKDERPAWARRFDVSQIVAGDNEGRWVIHDNRSKDWMGQPKQVGGRSNTYATEQEALDAIPLAAVSMKHRAVPTGTKGADGEYTYEIWRDINDRKRVKVVDQTFPSRIAAMEYMAKNAQAILETNTTFGEADLPTPDDTNRQGVARREGDVDGKDFMETFGFRGVEFGNWVAGDEFLIGFALYPEPFFFFGAVALDGRDGPLLDTLLLHRLAQRRRARGEMKCGHARKNSLDFLERRRVAVRELLRFRTDRD